MSSQVALRLPLSTTLARPTRGSSAVPGPWPSPLGSLEWGPCGNPSATAPDVNWPQLQLLGAADAVSPTPTINPASPAAMAAASRRFLITIPLSSILPDQATVSQTFRGRDRRWTMPTVSRS